MILELSTRSCYVKYDIERDQQMLQFCIRHKHSFLFSLHQHFRKEVFIPDLSSHFQYECHWTELLKSQLLSHDQG